MQQTLKKLKNSRQLYIFLIIPVAYIILFNYWPMYGAQIAFKKYTYLGGIWNSPWIGFDNFTKFFSSYYFWRLIKNTVGLNFYNLIVGFPFPILLALCLNYVRSNFYKKTVQMVTYAPHFISTVVIVGLIMQFLDPRIGIVNNAITFFGGTSVNFIGEAGYFQSIYVWSGIWQNCGYSSIVYIAALAGIPTELHEAAIIDGANKLRRIWHIDLPGIMSTAVILLILNFGYIMNVGFEKVYLMQNPLNLSTSEVINTYVYRTGMLGGAANFSYSTAIGLFQSFIGFFMLIIVNSISKRLGETSLW
jgi:ABC-type polysaccharide transport system, permease component